VFGRRIAKDHDIVQVRETEIKFFEDVVHETLEGLDGISEDKGYEGKFEYGERSVNGVFGCCQENLVECSDEVDIRK
jgi:hypothetical protein